MTACPLAPARGPRRIRYAPGVDPRPWVPEFADLRAFAEQSWTGQLRAALLADQLYAVRAVKPSALRIVASVAS